MPMATLTRYTTGGGVVIDDGRVLLLDRPSRQEIRLPKGHVDAGESPQDTALRETAEETGYADLELLHDLGAEDVRFRYRGKEFLRTEHYYLMRLVTSRQVARPGADAAQFTPIWHSFAQALALLSYEEEQEVLRKAIVAWKCVPEARKRSGSGSRI